MLTFRVLAFRQSESKRQHSNLFTVANLPLVSNSVEKPNIRKKRRQDKGYAFLKEPNSKTRNNKQTKQSFLTVRSFSSLLSDIDLFLQRFQTTTKAKTKRETYAHFFERLCKHIRSLKRGREMVSLIETRRLQNVE